MAALNTSNSLVGQKLGDINYNDIVLQLLMKYIHQLNDILCELDKFGGYFIDFTTTRDIQAGILRLHANENDTQEPHPVDEVYFVIQGNGTININGKNYPIKEGTSIFVPASTEHRFHSNSEDLVVFYALGSSNTAV